MPRHVANARAVANFLADHAAVATVTFPQLPSHPDHALANRLLPLGAGAVISFELKGTTGTARLAGKTFIEKLSLFSHLANIGDAKSLVIHPASTTHFRMDAAALALAGIGEGSVRLSIGLEHIDDLIEDLARALAAAAKVAGA
jgi:O-acetylhomoserine (thiol)-lyase